MHTVLAFCGDFLYGWYMMYMFLFLYRSKRMRRGIRLCARLSRWDSKRYWAMSLRWSLLGRKGISSAFFWFIIFKAVDGMGRIQWWTIVEGIRLILHVHTMEQS